MNLFRNYELRTAFAPQERRRLPTTLVTGWLGSGKTTVMRHVLANRQDLRVACVVNDFAELNIDAELVARDDNGVMPGVGAGKNVEGVVELTLLGGAGFTGADRPDRLVGDEQGGGNHLLEARLNLAMNNPHGFA